MMYTKICSISFEFGLHWAPLITSKKMQRKLLIVKGFLVVPELYCQ